MPLPFFIQHSTQNNLFFAYLPENTYFFKLPPHLFCTSIIFWNSVNYMFIILGARPAACEHGPCWACVSSVLPLYPAHRSYSTSIRSQETVLSSRVEIESLGSIIYFRGGDAMPTCFTKAFILSPGLMCDADTAALTTLCLLLSRIVLPGRCSFASRSEKGILENITSKLEG